MKNTCFAICYIYFAKNMKLFAIMRKFENYATKIKVYVLIFDMTLNRVHLAHVNFMWHESP